MKKGFKIIGYIIGVLIIIRLGYPLLFPVYQVTTDSMEPTIHKGAYIMVSKMHYKSFSTINSNDAILDRNDISTNPYNPVSPRSSAKDTINWFKHDDVISLGPKNFVMHFTHHNISALVNCGLH